ncbi:hypothetical protein HQN60_00695 [Deefgea piscis]|uniref:Type 4 fimbrial biogenesis protein PilX N-terminal domain-containing protein n=1 Tax=Deefgea piscis TaxID=2739061 RepID=A0A6M8SU44_9NEIS|nr:hypothetical protein [Deefgea piscis]QKJ65377.1 hypothetical protein HQN60_00695 [Deefgea piscis]
MNKINYNNQSKQIGIAALLVTVMLALIAGVATIYVNRSGLLLQRSVTNNSQSVMATQAAEAGINAFYAQIKSDIDLINSTGSDGVILRTNSVTSAASCAPATSNMPYEITSTYSDSSKQQFAPDKYFKAELPLLGALSNVNPQLAYRVQAKLSNNKLYITSEGLTGSESGLINNGNSSDSYAKIRRTIPIAGGLNLPNTAVTIGGYADSSGSINIGTTYLSDPKPLCAVAFGDEYNYRGSPSYTCSAGGACSPLQDASLQTNLFEKIFNSSKSDYKNSKANRVLPNCTGPITVTDNEVVWISGDANNCTISGSNKAIIIVEGNVTGSLVASGFVYATNVFQNGAMTITGSLAIESKWDIGNSATYLNGFHQFPNHKNDSDITQLFNDGITDSVYGPASARPLTGTHDAKGAIHVFYKPLVLIPVDPLGTTISSNSWIDF